MRRFDLVLTYNWGAFDAVMANAAVRRRRRWSITRTASTRTRPCGSRAGATSIAGSACPPRIRLVVPSRAARDDRAARPGASRRRGSCGSPTAFRSRASPKPPVAGAIPGFKRAPGEVVIGTVAGLRAVKNLPRLVRAFAAMTDKKARLVIVGEGPESERIAAEARDRGVADRLLMPGFLADPARYDRAVRHLRSVVGQRAIPDLAGRGDGRRPAGGGDRGRRHARDGVRRQSAADRRSPTTRPAFAAALDSLAEHPDLRRAIGAANREKAVRRL